MDIKKQDCNLPELTGTEKQIQWAESIRENAVNTFNCKEDIHSKYVEIEEYFEALRYMTENVSSSSEWISWYHLIQKGQFFIVGRKNADVFFRAYDDMILRFNAAYFHPDMTKELKKLQEEVERELEETAYIYPENYNHIDVKIINDCGIIKIISPKNDEIIDIAKSLKYRWAGECWALKMNVTLGESQDRIAEIGNKLLNSGFGVRIDDEKVRGMAISGNYKPYNDRWILKLIDAEGILVINFDYNDDIYHQAMRIPSAKWQNKMLQVEVNDWQEILDFAGINSFEFSSAAKLEIEKQKVKENEIQKKAVSVAKADEEEQNKTLEDILERPGELLEDLKDD